MRINSATPMSGHQRCGGDSTHLLPKYIARNTCLRSLKRSIHALHQSALTLRRELAFSRRSEVLFCGQCLPHSVHARLALAQSWDIVGKAHTSNTKACALHNTKLTSSQSSLQGLRKRFGILSIKRTSLGSKWPCLALVRLCPYWPNLV
jgi:hypothetical protein